MDEIYVTRFAVTRSFKNTRAQTCAFWLNLIVLLVSVKSFDRV